jgi:protein tyrosine/serine phosphatase
MSEIKSKKQSILCDLSIENFKKKIDLLNINDLCPVCKLYNIDCFLYNHKEKIKYFYAYETNNFQKYKYDQTKNIINLLEESF